MKTCKRLICLIFSSIILFSCHNEDASSLQEKNKEQIEKELASLQDFLNINKDSAGLRLKVAMLMDSVGQYDNALKQMDTLLMKDSTNFGLLFAKGQIYQDKKDTTNAIQFIAKATKIYPSPDAMLELASLYAEKKNPKALQITDQVRTLEMGHDIESNVHFVRGVYYARINDSTKALNELNSCLSIDYNNMPAYIEKGLIYFDHKQYDQALKIFSFAANVNKMYPDAYYYQARCYEMLGQKEKAIENFKLAKELDPTFTQAEEGLERLHA